MKRAAAPRAMAMEAEMAMPMAAMAMPMAMPARSMAMAKMAPMSYVSSSL